MSAAPSAGAPPGAVPAAAGVPVSLHIPAIGVDESQLLRLGIADDGTAEVPQDHDRVGWFDRGTAPAPTVLLGHVDSRDGPAVFIDLADLAPGDVIEVGRDDGSVDRYAVERTEQMPKDAFPTFAVFGGTSPDQLRLVTCAGDFDRGHSATSTTWSCTPAHCDLCPTRRDVRFHSDARSGTTLIG